MPSYFKLSSESSENVSISIRPDSANEASRGIQIRRIENVANVSASVSYITSLVDGE